MRETKLDIPVDRLEIGILARILAERDDHRSIHGPRRARPRHVVHLNVPVDVAHHKAAVDVADLHAALVHRFHLDIDVARYVHQEIHLDAIPLVVARMPAIVALAPKWAVHVQLQRALFLRNVQRHFLLRPFELFFRLRLVRPRNRKFHFVRCVRNDFDGSPHVVDFQ